MYEYIHIQTCIFPVILYIKHNTPLYDSKIKWTVSLTVSFTKYIQYDSIHASFLRLRRYIVEGDMSFL